MLSQCSRLVGVANGALPVLWSVRVLEHPVLDADWLCDKVRRETGLSDFGGDWFREALHVLVKALNEEAELNALGRFGAFGQLRKVLRDRLLAQQFFAEHPEIERRALERPVIVVGPMRSGTTRLHRLLAADERFAHLRFFETVCPVPSLGFERGGRDGRWMMAAALHKTVRSFNPLTSSIHPTGPFEPEEELGLLVRSIWGMKHEAQWHVPGYGRWSEEQDATPAYQYMAKLLRLVGWARDEDDARPWVLKTPQHMLDLPALLRTFPDARLIFTHREPKAVVGSSCSLVWNQMIIHSDHVDPHAVGREWLRKTELQITRMRRGRLQIPESRRIDLRYEDMDRDWQGTMRGFYEFLDMDIEPALPAMARYISSAEQERHLHPHCYALSDFGLDADCVSERFRSYTGDFGLEESGASRSGQADPGEAAACGLASDERWSAPKV
ncbi:MAG: sulfotransferase, partial [Novosphingobium sp.]|nr:sulfotransferase [Novosphingobium sp.]